MESDALQTFIIAVVIFGYGTGVSWVEERYGKFHDLSSGYKQLVNAVLALVVPYAVILVAPYWRPEFGSPEQMIYTLAYLIVPVLVWLVSQAAHAVDPAKE